ncbi:hypothetical protein QF046_001398 [Microbacterium sp. W4I4]|uniref:hypothetical protein n=1 Tax=Microbacterium sp. W4I4 TaxID=3042295 RepID=UPI00277D85ED|nr:hypothetical protein [Microbacterium sp. W4I4]MDQ0613757.1 hypothetical protein [Microbacterium sp. W4I4]
MTAVRAANVGSVDENGIVYAAVLPDGPIFVLTDDAAAAWRAVARADAAEDRYVAALVDAGLLTIEKES